MRNEKVIKICVLGGGNIGTLLLADLSKNDNVITMLHTSRPNVWKKNIEVLRPNGVLDFIGRVDIVSDDPLETIAQADIVISTLPTNVLIDSMGIIKQHIKKDALLGFIPGSGGKEFLFRDLINAGHTIFGFQRVHAISRVNVYGDSVFNLGRKDELFFGSIPAKESKRICTIFSKLLNVKCTELPNYLSVTLVPSNPILHTSRLYSMFKDYREGLFWEKEILFYKEWTDEASKVLLSCDEELQSMLRKIKNINTEYIRSLKEHYGVGDCREMTMKITGIPAFSSIKAPMKINGNGFIPDFESRYFKEDFPYGLCIIRSFAHILHHSTPNIDLLLRWYEEKYNLHFFNESEFSGTDLNILPLPQNYGINTAADIVNFYCE
jgi:hypothetical protein